MAFSVMLRDIVCKLFYWRLPAVFLPADVSLKAEALFHIKSNKAQSVFVVLFIYQSKTDQNLGMHQKWRLIQMEKSIFSSIYHSMQTEQKNPVLIVGLCMCAILFCCKVHPILHRLRLIRTAFDSRMLLTQLMCPRWVQSSHLWIAPFSVTLLFC